MVEVRNITVETHPEGDWYRVQGEAWSEGKNWGLVTVNGILSMMPDMEEIKKELLVQAIDWINSEKERLARMETAKAKAEALKSLEGEAVVMEPVPNTPAIDVQVGEGGSVTVSGSVDTATAEIVVAADTAEVARVVPEDGKFSVDISLDEGDHVISVVAYNSQGFGSEPASQTITVPAAVNENHSESE